MMRMRLFSRILLATSLILLLLVAGVWWALAGSGSTAVDERVFVVVLLLFVIAILALALLIQRLVVHPLKHLMEAHERLLRGDWQGQLAAEGSHEFVQLIECFNRVSSGLRESERRFAAMFDAAPYPVVVNRISDGNYVEVNPAYLEFSGLPREALIGRNAVELGVTDAATADAQRAALLASGRLDGIELEYATAGGAPRWLLYSSRVVEIDGEKLAISMLADITAQKHVEIALRESEASFNTLFELAPIPLAYTTRDDGYRGTHWNEAWYRNFGYSPAEAEGVSGADIGLWVNPEDRQRYLDATKRDATVSGMAVRMRRKNGSERNCHLFGRFIRAAGRELLMTAYLDTTEQQFAEDALRARELWLQRLFDLSPAGIMLLDADGKIAMCNQRLADILGYELRELVGRPYLELVHPTHAEAARAGVGRMLEDDSYTFFSAERAYLRKDGAEVLALLSAARLDDPGLGSGAILATVNDISSLKTAEARLRASEAELQAVFNASPVAMIVSDVARNYASVSANDAWERQFLRRREDVMGLTGAEMGLWASLPDRDRVLATIVADGAVSGFETRLVRGDGVELTCRISARKAQVGDRELLVMVQEDVSDLRRAERSLIDVNDRLARQLALSDAVARAQADFIANAQTEAFSTLLADLLALTGSEYGFVGEVLFADDGAPYLKTHALTNIAWNDETRRLYDESASAGLEFRNLKTLFGAALSSGRPVIANDPARDARRGGLPPGHPPLNAFLGIPVHVGGRLIAMAGLANRAGGYDEALVDWVHPLLLTVGQMVEARRAECSRLAAEAQLRELNEQLDERVRARTSELDQANRELSGALDTLQRAQNDLVRSEKLAALGSVVAGVAHELNTPIGNSVTVASTLVEMADQFDQTVHEGPLRRSALLAFIGRARDASRMLLANLQRASNLITSFKQVAVDQASEQRRQFGLAEVVDEILVMLQPQMKKRPVELRVAIDSGIVLDSYPGPFGQVVANLVNNALFHAFDDGGRKGNIDITGKLVDGRVRVTIADDGVGVPVENLRRIFDPFFTTRLGRGGSGLGLNIVYNIVTGVLGGEIRVESAPGQGTCFSIELPLVAPQRAESQPSNA